MRGWRRNGERVRDGKFGTQGKRCIVVAGERCPFGVCCKFGLLGVCVGEHSEEDEYHFEGKRAGVEREKRAACAFCLSGCCKWAGRPSGCWRGSGDSDYSSSEGEKDVESGSSVNGGERRAGRGHGQRRKIGLGEGKIVSVHHGG